MSFDSDLLALMNNSPAMNTPTKARDAWKVLLEKYIGAMERQAGTPTDGQVPVWSTANQKWEFGSVSAGNHAGSHENSGGDELDLTGMSGLLETAQTPAAHKSSHEDGGGDELNLTGMSGLLATAQTPIAHAHGVSFRVESSSFTAGTSSQTHILTATSPITVTLPPASGNGGLAHVFKAKTVGLGDKITIEGDGTDDIDKNDDVVLYVDGDFVRVESDDTDWWITNSYLAPHYSKIAKSNSQTIGSGSVLVQCNVIEKQNVGIADISPVSASHLKVLRTGWYDVDFSGSLNNLDAGKYQSTKVFVATVEVRYGRSWSSYNNLETPNAYSTSQFLNENDVVELKMTTNQTGLGLDTVFQSRPYISVTERR